MKYTIVNLETGEVNKNLHVAQNGLIIHNAGLEVNQDDYKVLRYTGLKDRRGIEIIEGDKVIAIDSVIKDPITARRRRAITRMGWNLNTIASYEIIGNEYIKNRV